ncbi:glycine cleavage system aminomethyltransferase GcvT [Haloparvum sp. PAK95]|uniref:glycine cleavage system aminomethyltransferase GcvT n=1 Tax=Haloparvum sp. PAK95 TaxID=3418962 RepID=UPI003D2EB464
MARQQPPLYEVHEAAGASFTDFGGWDMPVEFDSIRTEHSAVRESAGIFDVSHMGEIEVSGPDATTLMQRLTTNDVTALDPGDSQYSTITDEDGIIIDDTVVYRLPDGTPAGEAVDGRLAAGEADGDHPSYLFIPNAGHDGQAYTRWVEYRDERDLDADVENTTDSWAMFAVQGPDAPDLVFDAVETGSEGIESTAGGGDAAAVRDLSKFQATHAEVAGVESWVARTGYTGEDGFEVVCPAVDAEAVWNAFDCQPCGLGARDTLRMEFGFLLSGQDFDPEENPRTPFEAAIGFAVALDTEFVGRDALAAQQEAGVDETFTGLVLEERGVPRHGYEITDGDGTTIGELTSGTMSPTLNQPIGLGYVDVDYADNGTEVAVAVRGEEKRATITAPPFID